MKMQAKTKIPTRTRLKMRLLVSDMLKAREKAPTSMRTMLPGPMKVETRRKA